MVRLIINKYRDIHIEKIKNWTATANILTRKYSTYQQEDIHKLNKLFPNISTTSPHKPTNNNNEKQLGKENTSNII